MKINKKIKYTNLIFKFVLVILFSYLIYKQVFYNKNISQLWGEVTEKIRYSNYYLLLLTVMLGFFNLSTEAFKWLQFDTFENINFKSSFRTVIMGLTLAMITPFQIGDYLGRSLSVDSSKSKSTLIPTFLSSLAQNMVTLILGLGGVIYYIYMIRKIELSDQYFSVILLVLLIILSFIIYFNINKIINFIIHNRYFNFNFFVNILPQISSPIKRSIEIKVLCLSLLRYIIFSTQFVLLLNFFGVKGELFMLFSSVFTIFLINTGIPMPAVLGFITRGEIALLVFGAYNTDKILILASSLCLWIINQLIPSIVGLIIYLKINVGKKIIHE